VRGDDIKIVSSSIRIIFAAIDAQLLMHHQSSVVPTQCPWTLPAFAQVVSALKQERRQLEHRCVSARERLRKVREEVAFFHDLNRSLELNKPQWDDQLQASRTQRAHCVGTDRVTFASRGH
jgi:hypothetical protein